MSERPPSAPQRVASREGSAAPPPSVSMLDAEASHGGSSKGTLLPEDTTFFEEEGVDGSRPEQSKGIRVVVRVRPLNPAEVKRGDRSVVECLDDKQTLTLSMGGEGRDKSYTFNSVIAPSVGQEEAFEACGVRPLLDKSLEG